MLALATWAAGAGAAHAAVFPVNDTRDIADASPGDGVCRPLNVLVCTLRAAVQEANALPGPDAITVPAGVFVLSIPNWGDDDLDPAGATGDLDLTGQVEIDGEGFGRTVISGGDRSRVFDVQSSADALIHDVTIEHGQETLAGGGGIYNRHGATLTLRDAILQKNAAPYSGGGGLSNVRGSATLDHVIVTGNSAFGGGGIYSVGASADDPDTRLTLRDVAVTYNRTQIETIDGTEGGYGGGLWISGTATFDRVTVSGNYAADGGGLLTWGVANITNSTFSGNDADDRGAGITAEGRLTLLKNVTVAANRLNPGAPAGNAAGIAAIDYVDAVNTIVAGSAGGPNCAAGAPLASAGHNLEDGANCGLVAVGDLRLTDPLLGPLADNSGFTQTHALLAGSPAIDAGDDASCSLEDQRLFPRRGKHCDIGAYEY
jgi:CSLREA domain-containing protein